MAAEMGLSRALTQTMGGAIALWTTAISRTRFDLRKKDFVKQKSACVCVDEVSLERTHRKTEVHPKDGKPGPSSAPVAG